MFSQPICHVACEWHRPQPMLHLFAGPATNWRWPFVIVALPSLLVTGVMLATTQEPPRGITEPALQVTALAMWPHHPLLLPASHEHMHLKPAHAASSGMPACVLTDLNN